jgi:CHAD domain-containing protein
MMHQEELAMAYCLARSDRTVADGVRRIACAQMDAARTIIAAPDRDTAAAIHDLRKHVKRLRGLIRMVKPGFSAFADENARLRDIGRSMADLRDSDVMIATLDALVTGAEDWPNFRAALTTANTAMCDPAATAATLARCAAMFGLLRGRAAEWKIKGRGFATAADGLSKSYTSAAKGLARVRQNATDTGIHDWRKRVKDHLYQVQIIAPVLPEQLRSRAKNTDRLAEILGQHHDLAVLRDRAKTLDLPKSEAVRLKTAISVHQAALLSQALPLGAKLFSSDARLVTDVWAKHWIEWHSTSLELASADAPQGSV